MEQLVYRQFGERHRLVAGTFGGGFFREEESPLLHEAFQVILGRIAGIQLPQFRQELILEHRFRRRHRPHGQMNGGLLPAGIERKAASAMAVRRTRVIAEYSCRQETRQTLTCSSPLLFLSSALNRRVGEGRRRWTWEDDPITSSLTLRVGIEVPAPSRSGCQPLDLLRVLFRGA